MTRRPLALVLLLLLAGCDLLGLPDPKATAAEGKATGAACRQAGRALEDCYQLNPNVPKASVFDGWREMNDYMTEQKLDIVRPTLPPVLPKSLRKKAAPATDAADAPADDKATDKAADKAATSAPAAQGDAHKG